MTKMHGYRLQKIMMVEDWVSSCGMICLIVLQNEGSGSRCNSNGYMLCSSLLEQDMQGFIKIAL